MKPDVQPFFHADSNTWTYLVRDPSSHAAAVIDPVLDFDAKAARTSTSFAQKVGDLVAVHALGAQFGGEFGAEVLGLVDLADLDFAVVLAFEQVGCALDPFDRFGQ